MKLRDLWRIAAAILLLVASMAVIGAAPGDQSGRGSIEKAVFVSSVQAALQKQDAASSGARVDSAGILAPDYKYKGVHWVNPRAVAYYVNPTSSGIGTTSTIAAIKASFGTWANASGPLAYRYRGRTNLSGGVRDNHNVVSWASISSQYPDFVAVTFIWYVEYAKRIVEVDTVMNSDLAWSYTRPDASHDLSGAATANAARYSDPTNLGTAGAYDIRNVMTHEAGHWLNLRDLYDSKDSGLTMYGYGAMGELTKDTLGYGDELGVEAVYR
jgi:hypothetical protein